MMEENVSLVWLWHKTLENLGCLLKAETDELFRNVGILAFRNDVLTLSVPDGITMMRLQKQLDKLAVAARMAWGDREITIELHNLQQVGTAIVPEESNWQSFVQGPGNERGARQAFSIAEGMAVSNTPLTLCGAHGMGKSHLLYLMANRVKQRDSNIRVIYTTAKQFVAELTDSLREGWKPEFLTKYNTTDVLLVDELEYLEGKLACQEELLQLFKNLTNCSKQVVTAFQGDPEALAEHLPQMHMWLQSGDVEQLELTEQLKQKIAQHCAESCGLHLSEQVLRDLAAGGDSYNALRSQVRSRLPAENLR